LLKASGKVTFLFRLGSRVCTCLPTRNMDDRLRDRIRPWILGWLACWCDKSDGGSTIKPVKP